MKWHRRLDAWVRSHPGRVDAIVAITAFVIFAAAPLLLGAGVSVFTGSRTSNLAKEASALFVGAALAWALSERRTHPRRALWVSVSACLVQVVVPGEPIPMNLFVPVLLYSITAYGARVDARWALAFSAIGSVLATLKFTGLTFAHDLPTYVAVLIFHVLICTVAWVAGDLTRTRRLALEAVADRARRLEQEQEQERALAAADERRRIAREMHDVVAHSLSVIIAQADGARYAAAADPEVAPRTLGTIAQTGREALREMRSLLGVLRADEDEAAPKAPAPDLARIPELVENTRRAGLSVSLTHRGEPLRPLPAGAGLTAFRAAQEALTNVLKHAGPHAAATLDLTWTSRGLTLSVTDTGRGATASDGLGRGQQGMRERASLYGGSATFGPRGGGGYAVTVFLPYQEI
ncbi:sensor histidine kinase [Galactobacter valiniphilus]|uniref:sensor histidine kinase n=1 Tax=Galactobacter valiniphilus TaxID=2676122 RepID=UPI00373568D3